MWGGASDIIGIMRAFQAKFTGIHNNFLIYHNRNRVRRMARHMIGIHTRHEFTTAPGNGRGGRRAV